MHVVLKGYFNVFEVFYLSKKSKITPCDTANALEGTILYRNVIDSATNGSGGGTGGNFRFLLCQLLHSRSVLISLPIIITNRCVGFRFAAYERYAFV